MFGRVASSYFDVIRHDAQRLHVKAFVRSTNAEAGQTFASDSVVVFFNVRDVVGTYRDDSLQLRSLLTGHSLCGGLRWSGTYSPFDYEASLSLFTVNHQSSALAGDVGFGAHFLDSVLTIRAGYERTPANLYGEFILKDFMVSLNDLSLADRWMAAVDGRPLAFIELSFEWARSSSGGRAKQSGDALVPRLRSDDWSFQGSFDLWGFDFGLRGEYQEASNTALLTRDALLFGNVSSASYERRMLEFAATRSFSSSSVGMNIGLTRWNGEAVGDVESWPFTTLAATVFDNRLYFDISGDVVLLNADAYGSILWGEWRISPLISLFSIKPDVRIRHWEPDFLAFGIKNDVTEQFPISEAWIARAQVKLEFPFSGLRGSIQLEQYLPVSVTKRQGLVSGPSGPPPPGQPAPPSATDGGRSVRLEIEF